MAMNTRAHKLINFTSEIIIYYEFGMLRGMAVVCLDVNFKNFQKSTIRLLHIIFSLTYFVHARGAYMIYLRAYFLTNQ